jgi:hypothetical protein
LLGKWLTGEHHVVHSHGELTGHGIGSFLPFPGLAVEVVSPVPEHFGMAADQKKIGTGEYMEDEEL